MNPSNDVVDDLFRAYFKAHEPTRWPAPPSQLPASARPSTASSVRWGSKAALALSAAILLAVGLWLSDSQRRRVNMPNTMSSQILREAEANGAKLLQPMIDMP